MRSFYPCVLSEMEYFTQTDTTTHMHTRTKTDGTLAVVMVYDVDDDDDYDDDDTEGMKPVIIKVILLTRVTVTEVGVEMFVAMIVG